MSLSKFKDWVRLHEQEDLGQIGGQMPTGDQMGTPPAGAGNQMGVSPPQHTEDESGLDLPSLIQRRLEMLMAEIEKKRSMPRDQQLQIFSQVLQGLAGQFGNVSRSQFQGAMQRAVGPGGQPSATPANQPQVTG